MSLQVSVIIATRDRAMSIVRLLRLLDSQTLAPGAFEVIVIDDGSAQPVGPMLDPLRPRYPLRHIRIDWSGQAVARHRGACLAAGDILVFVDDDMQVPPDFLAAHLARHAAQPRAVVLGHLRTDPGIGRMPLFERFNARQIERWRAGVLAGRVKPRGMHLCTGNVSMTRADYHAVGGFNPSLQRSEDRELGIRLEKSGCAIVYGDEAATVHCSDHDDQVWLRRAYLYGRFDHRIAALHRDMADAHPWRFWSLIHPLSRPVLGVALVAPRLGRIASLASYRAARLLDRLKLRNLALTLTALSYALEYFRGLREECGSFRAFWKDRPAPPPRPQGPFREMLAAIRADHNALRANRLKYNEEIISSSRLPLDLVRKVGFQMLAWYRLMRFVDASAWPVLPMIIARLIRHLYGADIHWKARIEPGVSIVHGNGLVLSHAAHVGEGCILFQNVTLGENLDPRSGIVGAPRLGRHVHVGPGATLVGPIDVGEGSKIAAGAVLMRSVPPASLVAAPEATVTPRSRRGGPVPAAEARCAS